MNETATPAAPETTAPELKPCPNCGWRPSDEQAFQSDEQAFFDSIAPVSAALRWKRILRRLFHWSDVYYLLAIAGVFACTFSQLEDLLPGFDAELHSASTWLTMLLPVSSLYLLPVIAGRAFFAWCERRVDEYFISTSSISTTTPTPGAQQ